jgi:phthalate 4,5-dioxygenase oxygenase subunit
VLSKEQNELLTQTGPGTPGGKLMRSYWQPVALSSELPIGGAPLSMRILGEDLVLFRDDQNRPGLLELYCSHRGTDLSFGRCENGGLRCIYHGWLYDVNGNCIEQPGEPEGSSFHAKVKQISYPCIEKAGFIFAFMGEGEPPLLPNYDFLEAPESHLYATKIWHECNYAQGNEGNIDPGHLSFLHRLFKEEEKGHATAIVKGAKESANSLQSKDPTPIIDTEETSFGLRVYTIRKADEERVYVKVSNFIYPNLSAVPGPTVGDGYLVNWHVPIDDTHHWKYMITFKRSAPLDKEYFRKTDEQDLTPDRKHVRNKSNRYLQDREEMKTKTFSGLGMNFSVHDAFAWESQGLIQDRTREHLGYSDKAVAGSRQLLLKAIKKVQGNEDPPHLVREEKANNFPELLVISEVLPKTVDWKEHLRLKEEDLKQSATEKS